MGLKTVLNFGLDMNNPFHRIIRRAVAIGTFTAISVGISMYLSIAPEWSVPILTATLAVIDKTLRELEQ